MWHLISGRRRADLAPALQLKHCKKKKEEKKKKNRTRNEIPTVTGARVYAAVHDITLYQVLAHHGSKVNSVLFVLPATCRSFALIYSPRCFSLPPS